MKTEHLSFPVIVLCGGEGTRMESPVKKKELIEIGGRPILWHVMRIYAAYGHRHFILALGYRAEDIKRYFLEYEPMTCDFTIDLGQSGFATYHRSDVENWKVTLADTGLNALRGARVYRAAKYIDADRFFVTYGEAVGNVDLDALLAFHRQHGRLSTVTGFAEKPVLDHWVNAGFMLFEREVLDYLADDDNLELETDVLPRLAADGELMMYRHTGYWRSMKTFKDAQELDSIWRESAPWKTW